jgi:hypothetical protein
MGKQCKMCFLGYGQFFFFSGMDRVLDAANAEDPPRMLRRDDSMTHEI